MPIVTNYPDGSKVTEYSPEETQQSVKICGKVARRLGYDRDKEEKDPRPSIQHVAQVVAWAFAYAPADHPLNESHPMWPRFFAHSEWFRALILQRFVLPAETSWEEIYRCTGFLVDNEYSSEEKSWEAHYFGMMTRLDHEDARRMLEELENIKYQVDGLI